MNPIIDLGSEVLIDRSRVRDPYMRLLLIALGQAIASGSPWVAISKVAAATYDPLLELIDGHLRHAAA
jgi:hypothetical protein